MSLYFYSSADFDQLCVQFLEDHKKDNSVFDPVHIIVGHNSTRQFLIDKIASELDIAANLRFIQSKKLIENIYKILKGKEYKKTIHSGQLVWMIDKLLSDPIFLNKAPQKLIEYLEGDTFKRFTLAEKINDLFSSYQEERPELIKAWNNNEFLLSDQEDERWQRMIWHLLSEDLQDRFRDFTSMIQEIYSRLDNDPTSIIKLKKSFKRLYFFGNLPYTKQVVDVLKKLSEYIEINIYLSTYEFDFSIPMVNNLSKYHKKIKQYWETTPRADFSVQCKISNKTQRYSLLSNVQDYLRIAGNNKLNAAYNKSQNLDLDDSLTISSAYAVSREVEAFYHFLLSVFSKDPSLKASDVCVVIPEIDQYAPFVKTFFDQPAISIPFSIFDTSFRMYGSPYAAMEALINFEEDRFTSVQVIKLLEYEFIRKKFGIHDLELLERAISQANIRHHIKGDESIESHLVSWRYGLKRLIYGYCLPPDQGLLQFGQDRFYPVDQFEESDILEILKLHQFVECLHNWLKERNQERSLKDWISYLEVDTFTVFIEVEDLEHNGFTALIGQLHRMDTWGYQEKVPFSVIKYFMLKGLQGMESGQLYGKQGVKFISPSMFISTPAKVYAFLGLNNNVYPRPVTKLSFDLSEKDRLTKTDYDKNLFLNIIMSTKQHLYLSYLGNSQKDNSVIPPSSILLELLYLLQEMLNLKDFESLITRHPLHAFNHRYNHKDHPKLIQYQLNITNDKLLKNAPNHSEKINQDQIDFSVIEMHRFIRFFEDGSRSYFNEVLKVYYGDHDIHLEEVEPFEQSLLDSWSLKDLMIHKAIHSNETSPKAEYFKKKGQLPLSELGAAYYDKTISDTEKIMESISAYLDLSNNMPTEVKIDLKLGEYTIKGLLDTYYEQADILLFACVSKNKMKYRIRAILRYLLVLAMHPHKQTKLLYAHAEGLSLIEQDENIEEIKANLIRLFDWFVLGQRLLIPYCAEASDLLKPDHLMAIEEALNKDEGRIELLQKQFDYALEDPYCFFSPYFVATIDNELFTKKENIKNFMELNTLLIQLTERLK